ncbi:MAG: hypothetical protein RBR40_06520 [Tenuifilaceae bacterium]|nr:hypothetical protein [Tenuifilaceae bacterium]
MKQEKRIIALSEVYSGQKTSSVQKEQILDCLAVLVQGYHPDIWLADVEECEGQGIYEYTLEECEWLRKTPVFDTGYYVPSYRIEPGSQVSAHMALAVWEIPELTEEFTPEDVQVYLEGLKAWLDAMDKIGWIEHTCDWDPYLRITLKDGTILRTELHYYLINRVTLTTLFIEAPDDSEGAEAPKAWDPILKFYDKETCEYHVPITEIVRIEIQEPSPGYFIP